MTEMQGWILIAAVFLVLSENTDTKLIAVLASVNTVLFMVLAILS